MESSYTRGSGREPITPVDGGDADLENFRQSWHREITEQRFAGENLGLPGAASTPRVSGAAPPETAKPHRHIPPPTATFEVAQAVNLDSEGVANGKDSHDNSGAEAYDQEVHAAAQVLDIETCSESPAAHSGKYEQQLEQWRRSDANILTLRRKWQVSCTEVYMQKITHYYFDSNDCCF